VSLLAVSPSWQKGDTLIATCDSGGTIRVHQVFVTGKSGPIVAPRKEATVTLENDTRFLGASVASAVLVSVAFRRSLQVEGVGVGAITALAMASQRGSKYFVVGDSEGKVNVFGLDGAFKSRLDGTSTPGAGIEGFYVHQNQLLFRAGPEWGYIDLENLVVKHVECPDFEGMHVITTVIDSERSWRVLVADEEGTIWVLAVQSARTCRVDYKFPRGLTRAPLDLVSLRGFVLALERSGGRGGSPGARGGEERRTASLLALNMSHVGKQEADLMHYPSPVVWKTRHRGVRSWAVFRHRQDSRPEGDLVALLSEDGLEVEIFELLMHRRVEVVGESLLLDPYIMVPCIVAAVLIGVGWHYLKYGRAMVKPSGDAAAPRTS